MTENNWWRWRSVSVEKILLFWCLHYVMQLLIFLIKDLVKEECRKSLAGLPRKTWMDIQKRMLCHRLKKYLSFYFVSKTKFLTEKGLKMSFLKWHSQLGQLMSVACERHNCKCFHIKRWGQHPFSWWLVTALTSRIQQQLRLYEFWGQVIKKPCSFCLIYLNNHAWNPHRQLELQLPWGSRVVRTQATCEDIWRPTALAEPRLQDISSWVLNPWVEKPQDDSALHPHVHLLLSASQMRPQTVWSRDKLMPLKSILIHHPQNSPA